MILIEPEPRLYSELSMAEVDAQGFHKLINGEVGTIDSFRFTSSHYHLFRTNNHRKRPMTAINLQLLDRAATIDDLYDLLPGRYWLASTSPSSEQPEMLSLRIVFQQKNTVRGKTTRRPEGHLQMLKPKSFKGDL